MRIPATLAVLLAAGCHHDAGHEIDDMTDAGAPGPDAVPGVHQVIVQADGTFTPEVVTIQDGETVEWLLHDRADTIISTTGGCAAAPFDASAPNQLVGPLPIAPSGVFALSPLASSTMASTWASPSIAGVFVRLLWSEIQTAPGDDDGSYDFAKLDAQLDAAIANGKLYSIGVKAGDDGTPEWIFSTNPDGSPRAGGGGGVVRLAFQDGASQAADCGVRMFLGNPTEPAYQQRYFAMLRKLAAHIRSRADWYRAIAYVKPSGANLFSHENRLPKRCDPGCVCNTQVFAEAGYTPSKLVEFYRAQYDLLEAEFPGKAMSFALIQDGWPSINDDGDYETSDGSSSGGPLPTSVHQLQSLLDLGQAEHGSWFVVQHNGLGPHPSPASCSSYDQHPAAPPFSGDGPCPNRWVLSEGADGQVTGFQTNNEDKVANPVDLESTLANLYHNSDGIFLEIYEERLMEADRVGVLDPTSSGRTLAGWAAELDARRRAAFPGSSLADPYPTTFSKTFVRTVTSGDEVLTYKNGTRCDDNPAAVGTVVIRSGAP